MMDDWDEPTGIYAHGYQPLTVHWALDAHAGLKAIWAFMAGSKLVYSDKWSPRAATLYTSGDFTLGISTHLGRTSTSRVLSAVFGEDFQNDAGIMLGEEERWGLETHPRGVGHPWRPPALPLWKDFEWTGERAGTDWKVAEDSWTCWGDPALSGLPRPQKLSSDPLEVAIPMPQQAPVEEGGILGWAYPLGVPAASQPRKPN